MVTPTQKSGCSLITFVNRNGYISMPRKGEVYGFWPENPDRVTFGSIRMSRQGNRLWGSTLHGVSESESCFVRTFLAVWECGDLPSSAASNNLRPDRCARRNHPVLIVLNAVRRCVEVTLLTRDCGSATASCVRNQ